MRHAHCATAEHPVLLLGQIMSLDVELERAAECDVEDLKTFANCQNRQPARERVLDSLKLPAVALGIDLFIQHRRIGNVLPQKFRGKYRSRLRVKGRPSHRAEHVECGVPKFQTSGCFAKIVRKDLASFCRIHVARFGIGRICDSPMAM